MSSDELTLEEAAAATKEPQFDNDRRVATAGQARRTL